jgi:hypothetical protein
LLIAFRLLEKNLSFHRIFYAWVAYPRDFSYVFSALRITSLFGIKIRDKSTMAELDTNKVYPVGAKVEIRDAVWRILSVDAVREGGQLLKCEGLSNIVLGRVVYFFTLYEDAVKLLTPEETVLAKDTSSRFIQTRLYIESILRTSPKTENDKLYVSYKAAMDPMPYQFDPALQALKQPRPRILIADAVGIGKTLEAGILTSELIARGRAKRILVLATKAVLPQFQQEFWNRFSIPLTALDSNGIQRVRERIPSNQNPFFYFDKAIISIDTLKKDELYREMISQCHWDLIIIDEAHNVAQRSNRSQRAKLAQLLSGKSDAMIMLSATPHDGRAESFASLLNVLDPTAIANPSDYTVDDYADKGLVIRRFKQDVASQVSSEFPERKISKIVVTASPAEEKFFDFLSDLRFGTLDVGGAGEKQHAGKQLSLSGDWEPQQEEDESSNGEIKGARLFRTTLILQRRNEVVLKIVSYLLGNDAFTENNGESFLTTLDENSFKHAHGVSEDLKYALREAVEILGNEAARQLKDYATKTKFPEATEISDECLRYLYRLLFLFFVESRPDLKYAPMNDPHYVDGYSLEWLRDLEMIPLISQEDQEGRFLNDSIQKLFKFFSKGTQNDAQALMDQHASAELFKISGLPSTLFDPSRMQLLANGLGMRESLQFLS